MSIEAVNYVKQLRVGKLQAKYILKSLAEYADERFSCFPSIALLAAEAEIGERAVQKHLAYLRDLGVMSDRESFRSNGSQTSNRYHLHGPWDDYAGTGVPFALIVTPKEAREAARAAMWAAAPAEGDFREGTAAAAALAGPDAMAAAAERAQQVAVQAEASKEALRERARKASAAARKNQASTPETADQDVPEEETAGEGGVNCKTPPPVSSKTPPPVSSRTPLEPPVVPTTSEANDAPSGRSPGEPRRASTGSRGSSDGGSAAPEKSSPAPQSEDSKTDGRKRVPKLTAEERTYMKAILQLLPSDLLAALGDVIPTTVGRSMVESLATGLPRERTPQQLVAHRLLPRWNHYWASKFYAGELTPEVNGNKRKPYGPLLQMLKDTDECSNLWCEDRHDFVLEADCQQCAMRKTDDKADRERERRAAQEDAERQARRGEAQKAAAEAAAKESAQAGGAPAGPVPAQRESMVLHTPRPRRECAEDSCALPLPEDLDDVLCRKCRIRADRAAEIYRRQQQVAGRYEAPEEELAPAGPAPF